MVSEGHGGGVLFPQVNIIIKEKYRVFMYFIFSE
jgi:hypothetical protein